MNDPRTLARLVAGRRRRANGRLPLSLPAVRRALIIYTRDRRVPLDLDDPDMNYARRSVQEPPDNSGDWVASTTQKITRSAGCGGKHEARR